MNWIIYFLFVSVTLGYMTIGENVYVIEIALLLALPIVFLKGGGAHVKKEVLPLDLLVLAYAVFGLGSVAAGFDYLFESARYFRAYVLTPVLIYVAFRYLPVDLQVFKRGIYFLVPFSVVQAAYLLRAYFLYGGRQQWFEGALAYTITLASLFVLAASIIYFMRKIDGGGVKSLLFYALFAFIVTALYFTFSRTALLTLIPLLLLAGFVWKRHWLLKQSGLMMAGVLAAFMVVLFSSTVVYQEAEITPEEQREIQRSSARLTNKDIFIQDLTGRFRMWSDFIESGMETPLLGRGDPMQIVGKSRLGSAHNFLVEALLASGMIGMILLIAIASATQSQFKKIALGSPQMLAMGKALWVSHISLVVVGITGGLGSGRMFLFFAIAGMAVRLSLYQQEKKSEPEIAEKPDKVQPRIIRRSPRLGLLK